MIKKAVIDFSAFVGEDKGGAVIIKELSIIDVDSKCVQHWVFKPPKGLSSGLGISHDCTGWHDSTATRHNKWLSKHYHGIHFESGSTEYESLQSALDFICNEVQLLFAASTEKAAALESLFDKQRVVFSLESLGCPPLPHDLLLAPPEGTMQCLLHHIYAPGFYCTQSNAHILANWCNANLDALDMNKVANREKTFVNWPVSSPSAKQLAEEGFVRFVSTKDSTKCVYCAVTLYKWDEGDDPKEDHDFNSPFCKFIRFKQQRDDTKETGSGGAAADYLRRFEYTPSAEELIASCHA